MKQQETTDATQKAAEERMYQKYCDDTHPLSPTFKGVIPDAQEGIIHVMTKPIPLADAIACILAAGGTVVFGDKTMSK